MSYSEAIAQLNALAPELYAQPGASRRKFTLDEIRLLCSVLGNPQQQFPSVLIAGTNGKGSTAATLASIARLSGIRVGLYTSPHLDRVNERIRIGHPDGEGIREISDADFARHYFAVHDAAQALVLAGKLSGLPSYFELMTAVAFSFFAEARIELAVLEVGMGGRLDATNIVEPLVSIITDISLDHQEWLGDTISAIAREKAGILRRYGVMVTLPQHPEANKALGEVATELAVRGVNAADYMPARNAADSYPIQVFGRTIDIRSPLEGAHQRRNIALAIAAAVELRASHALPITAASITQGIRATHWPGRMEHMQCTGWPEVIFDVAHNPAGAWALRSAFAGFNRDPQHTQRKNVLVFGCLRDKPASELAQILFPLFDSVVLTPVPSPRTTDVSTLRAAAEQTGASYVIASDTRHALETARELAGITGRILVSGSVYLVGAARHLLLEQNRQEHAS